MGIYPAAARWSYQHGSNSTFIVLVTTFSRLLILYVCCIITKQKILQARNSNWKAIVSGGVLQAISIVGILSSVALIPGPVALTILFTHTLMLYGLCVVTGEERFTMIALACTAMALVGVTQVVGLWDSAVPLNIWGVVLAFIAAIATMGRAYLFGHQVKSDHPMVVGVWTFIVAFPITILLVLFCPAALPVDTQGIVAALLAALSLGLGTVAAFYGIALLGAFQFSLFLKIEPIFTALFSIIILSEYLSFNQYVGIATVLASLVGYQVFISRQAGVVRSIRRMNARNS